MLAVIGVPLAMESGYSPSPVGKLVFAAGDYLKPNTQFALVDFKEPTAVWEMRRVTKSFAQFVDPTQVRTYLNQPGPRAVIVSKDQWQQAVPVIDPGWQTYGMQGFNAAKGKTIDLTMIVKP